MDQNNGQENGDVAAVAIIEANRCWYSAAMDEDTALTLFAVASEDPSTWDDIALLWPRYRTPVVPEFASGLSLHASDQKTIQQAITETDRWLVIDLPRKRIVSGRDFLEVGRDQAFVMKVDDDGSQHWPLSIHLPPWWELHEQVSAELVDRDRERPIEVPRPNRTVLYGDALVHDLAGRVLDVVDSDRWRSSDAPIDERRRYEFTLMVHRDWLMTPRDDLGGKSPRGMLHGATGWIEHLSWAQRIRFEDGGPIVAVSDQLTGFDDVPMGREEICVYFDLCRELISAGWFWACDAKDGRATVAQRNRDVQQMTLAEYLADVQANWLREPFEEGSPPRFILECSRRRVPRGAGVEIVGMTERESEQHELDCDCPICEMMADGLFGVGFTAIDGHHLELDNEFAFSLWETHQEWELEQREFRAFAAELDRKEAQSADGDAEPQEYASVWSGLVSDDLIPCDANGNLKLAFLLAEVVAMLESFGGAREEIVDLNERFSDYRRSDAQSQRVSGERLKTSLEQIAAKHPELVSRSADLQSRIDESLRQYAGDSGDEFLL